MGLIVLMIGSSIFFFFDVHLTFIYFIPGVARYFTVQKALTKGIFPIARAVTVFLAFGLATLFLLTFGILAAGELEHTELP